MLLQKWYNMKSRKISLVAILILLAERIHGQSIVSPPADLTGLLGGTASFDCEMTFGPIEEMSWKFNGTVVYSVLDGIENYPEGAKKYSVNRIGNRFMLHIKNLGFLDGGIYTCTAFLPKATASLIVLGIPSISSDPYDRVEGETVNYKCEARFGGPSEESTDHYPKIQMFLGDIQLNELLPESKISYKTESHCLIMMFNLTVDASLQDKQLKCEIGTTLSRMKSSTTTVLNVMYPVHDIEFFPSYTEYEVGSHLTCTADGNPSPSYEWRNLIDIGYAVRSRWLNVTKDMLGQNEWECTARNLIREKPHEKHILAIFKALDSSTNGSSGSLVIAVTVTLILIISVLGIVVYIFREKILNYLRNGTNGKALEHKNSEEGVWKSLIQMKNVKSGADMMKNLQGKEDLDIHGQSILNLLKEDGKGIFECDPDILLVMIQKAKILIESKDYIDIIKEMANCCSTVPGTLESCPLQCLIQLMTNSDECEVLMKHQNRLLSLIQAVTVADVHIQSRTECLGNLILHSEYISSTPCKFEWSAAFFTTLNLLLKKGADPNWIPHDSFSNERPSRMSAQDIFFSSTFDILLEQVTLITSIMNILSYFLDKKCTIVEHLNRTILHALVDHKWEVLKEISVPQIFFVDYKKILSEVLRHDPSLIDKKDCFERTPLQVFMEKLHVPGALLKDAKDCVLLLKSNDNIKTKDHKGQTVLHYVAQSFSSLAQLDSQEKNTFLDIVRNLASESNNYIQDNNGQTSLHVMAYSYNENVPNQEIFLNLVQILKPAANIQNNDGHTVLHVMAEKYNGKLPYYCKKVFLGVVKLLFNKSNCNIQDKQGRTILHILVDKFEEVPTNDQKEFMKIMNLLFEYQSASIQDAQGRTILHIAAEHYKFSMPFDIQETFLDIFYKLLELFINRDNVDIAESEGRTILHIMAEKFPGEVSEPACEAFFAAVKYLAHFSNTGSQDNMGRTALHIIFENYNLNISQHCKNMLSDLVKLFKPESSNNIQDNRGFTVLHIIGQKIYQNPGLSPDFLPILPVLTTPHNVNAKDANSLTPYGWILKAQSDNKDQEFKKMLSKIQKMFSNKGADSKIAKLGFEFIE